MSQQLCESCRQWWEANSQETGPSEHCHHPKEGKDECTYCVDPRVIPPRWYFCPYCGKEVSDDQELR